jgi:hypothetical protein
MSAITTAYEYLPIPIRQFSWSAHREDFASGQPMGFGRTEQEAIANLRRQEPTRLCFPPETRLFARHRRPR